MIVVLLVAAIAVSAAIYVRGGFSLGYDETLGGCGTVNLPAITNKVTQNGEVLFKANCTSCHAMDKKLVGPALMGMQDRLPYKNFIEDLLLRPKQTLRRNKYAMELSKEYGDEGHIDFHDVLSPADVEAIIEYSKFYTQSVPQVVAKL